MNPENKPDTRLIPIPKWNEYHPWPKPAGLRHLRFNQSHNGFASAFKKVGARVLVDEGEFFRCVERQQGGQAA